MSESEKAKKARGAYQAALRKGELVPAGACERCGAPPADRRALDGHHPALIAKPLRVEWLCRACHGKQHYWEVRAGVITWEQWQARFPDLEPGDVYEPLPGDPPTLEESPWHKGKRKRK